MGILQAPSVIINGGNGDANATAIIETDTSNPYFGQVTSIVVDNNGTGYDANTTIRLLGGFPKVKPSGEASQLHALITVQGIFKDILSSRL